MKKRDLTARFLATEHGLMMNEVKAMTGKSGSTLVRYCRENRQLFLIILKGCQRIKQEAKNESN